MNRNGWSGLDPQNPYPGLHWFEEQDRAYFFGRDHEIDELFRLVQRDIATVLFGRSGLGKTSLLRAGLFPRLRGADFLPLAIHLTLGSEVGLVDQIKQTIACEIKAHGIDGPAPDAGQTLWEYFHRAQLWTARNRLLIPVLVCDQFEEIFTIGRDDPGLPDLITELADVIENQIPVSVRASLSQSPGAEIPFDFDKPRVKVILSLREDFLADLEEVRGKIPALGRNRVRLLPLTVEQARTAAMEPGADLVSAAVADQIVRFVAGAEQEPEATARAAQRRGEETVEPALLSLVCRELNERRLARRLDRITEDLLAGSRDRILAEFYAQCIEDLDPAVGRFVEDYLITAHGFRNTMALDNATDIAGVTQDAIDTLVRRRLLRREERLGNWHVELIHDVLTEPVRVCRDQHQREAARREELRRWRRRLAIAGIAVAIGVGGIFAWSQYRFSQELQAMQLVTRAALAQAIGDPELSLRYADASVRAFDPPLPKALGALQRALHGSSLDRAFAKDDRVDAVALSADGHILTSADFSGNVLVQHVDSGREPLTLAHPKRVRDITFSPDDRRLATACDDGLWRVWDLDSGAMITDIEGHGGKRVNAIAWNASGERLLTGGDDHIAQLWDLERPEAPLVTFLGHTERVLDVAFAPDDRRVATAGVDGQAIIWDMLSGERLLTIKGHRAKVNALDFSPNGERLATASQDETVRIWDTRPPADPLAFLGQDDALLVLRGHTGQIWDLAYMPDGQRLATAAGDRTVRIWDAADGSQLQQPLRHRGIVYKLSLSGDGQQLASASADRKVRIWRTPPRHAGAVLGVAFAPDGQTLATSGKDGTVRLWDRASLRQDRELYRGDHSVYQLAFRPDGGQLALAVWDRKARILDPDTGRTLHRLEGHEYKLLDLAYRPNRSQLLTGAYGSEAFLWDTEKGHLDWKLPPCSEDDPPRQVHVHGVAFSPDGDRLAIGCWRFKTRSGYAVVRNADSFEEVARLPTSDTMVNALAFAPDGGQLAIAGTNGLILLWQIGTDQEPTVIDAHDAYINELAYSPETGLLASAGGMGDHRVLVWDVKTRKVVRELLHADEVFDVAFSADGQWLATACADGRFYVYPVTTKVLLEQARQRFVKADAGIPETPD